MLFENWVLTGTFYVCLAVFSLGCAWKIFSWFRLNIGTGQTKTRARLAACVKGVVSSCFSRNILSLLRVFILDVLLQARTARQDGYRWIMHLFIYWGFMGLVLFHALGATFAAPLFGTEFSNLNPCFFMRDLFGVLVLAGAAMAVFRRLARKNPRPLNHGMDVFALALVFLIILSGVGLEGAKIASYEEFMNMVEIEGGLDPETDEEDILALESLWAAEYGLSSPNLKGPFDPDILEAGREANEAYCVSCHVSTKWAPAGFLTAKALGPFTALTQGPALVRCLYWIHLLLCFLGLAYLPFSKMFHIIATPVSLLAGAVMDKKKIRPSLPENLATRRAMELDACTHCGACSSCCSAIMASEALGNPLILPSEKMVFLKKLSRGKKLSPKENEAVSQGIALCTRCDRCTVACPSGINLKDLWSAARRNVLDKAGPQPLVLSPLAFVPGLSGEDSRPVERAYHAVAGRFPEFAGFSGTLKLNGEWGAPPEPDPSYSSCFGCRTCTSSCPVVASHEYPEQDLGLLPHQIIHGLKLGLVDAAQGCRMIWSCLTCYACQEACPQNVRLTDLFYGLKNTAARAAASPSEPKPEAVP